jgi:8-oxo-dGTP pyrophosphatase MutT (NUDIX family)
MKNWQTHDTKIVYENNWIQVQHHNVTDPSGGAGIYGVVNFKNIAVGVLPIDTYGNIWLVGQYRYPLQAYSWEIPEGGCPIGTDPLHTAQRELHEETGITAQKYQQLLTMHLSNSVTNEYGVVYIATGLSFGTADPEPTEDLRIQKMPFDHAYQLLLQGKITDSLSVAALLKLKIMQLENQLPTTLSPI